MVAWPAQGFGCSLPSTQPCHSQRLPLCESQVVGCKVAVWGDMLRVIEALMRQGRVAGGQQWGPADWLVVWKNRAAFRWELAAGRSLASLEKSDFHRVPSRTD